MYGIWYTIMGKGRRHADWLRDPFTRGITTHFTLAEAEAHVQRLTLNLGPHARYVHYAAAPIPFVGAVR